MKIYGNTSTETHDRADRAGWRRRAAFGIGGACLATAACGIGTSSVQALGPAPSISASEALHCKVDNEEAWGFITLTSSDAQHVTDALDVTKKQANDSYYGAVKCDDGRQAPLYTPVDVADKSGANQRCLVWAVNPTHVVCPGGNWR